MIDPIPPRGEAASVRRRVALAVAAGLLPVVVGITGRAARASFAQIRIGGSGAGTPVVERLLQAFRRLGHPIDFAMETVPGSDGGVGALLGGRLDIAIADRPLTAADIAAGVRGEAPYGWSPLPFVVNSSAPIERLRLTEVAAIYAGTLTTWPDGTRIRIVRRPSSEIASILLRRLSPLLAASMEAADRRRGLFTAADDTENADALETIPGAFGAMVLGQLLAERRSVRPLRLDGMVPVPDGVDGEHYPVGKALYLFVRETSSPVVTELLSFIRGPDGIAVLRELGHRASIPDRDPRRG